MPKRAKAFFEKIRRWLLSKKWVRWALKKRLFTLVPLAVLSVQLHFERRYGKERAAEVRGLVATNEFLLQRLQNRNRRIDDFHFAIWEKLYKGGRFLMVNVNRKYSEAFLKKLGLKERDYVGYTDFEVHPYEAARAYYVEDSIVAFTGDTIYALSYFEDKMGGREPLLITKWRRLELKDTLVMGAALRLDDILEEIKELSKQNRIEKKNE